jgi:hypothetical protein
MLFLIRNNEFVAGFCGQYTRQVYLQAWECRKAKGGEAV